MGSPDKRSAKADGPKPKRTKTVDQKYKQEYSLKYPVITSSRVSASHAFCTVCRLDFGVAHGGAYDCTKHVNGTAHKLKANVAAQSTKITSFMCESREYDVINAEVMFTNFIIEHNLPIAASDHAGAIFKKMFPDSGIAKKYGCGRTKTTAIIQMLGDEDDREMSNILRTRPYSLATGKKCIFVL